MEVVCGHPGRIGGIQTAGGQVGEGTQATRALEDCVDHLRGDAEVAQGKHRPAGGHGLQRGCRGHRGQATGLVQRLVHRPGREPNRIRSDPPLPDQVGVQLRIRPRFVVGLPLGAERTQLDHRRTRLGQGQQDLLPIGAGRRHLGLGREEQLRHGGSGVPPGIRHRPGRRDVRILRSAGKVRQRGQPEGCRHRQLVGQLGELGDLPVAVQHEQVAAGPQGDGPRRGGHADSGQAGDQYRTVGRS